MPETPAAPRVAVEVPVILDAESRSAADRRPQLMRFRSRAEVRAHVSACMLLIAALPGDGEASEVAWREPAPEHLPECDGLCGGSAVHEAHREDGCCPCCYCAQYDMGDGDTGAPGGHRDGFWDTHPYAAAALASVPGAGLDEPQPRGQHPYPARFPCCAHCDHEPDGRGHQNLCADCLPGPATLPAVLASPALNLDEPCQCQHYRARHFGDSHRGHCRAPGCGCGAFMAAPATAAEIANAFNAQYGVPAPKDLTGPPCANAACRHPRGVHHWAGRPDIATGPCLDEGCSCEAWQPPAALDARTAMAADVLDAAINGGKPVIAEDDEDGGCLTPSPAGSACVRPAGHDLIGGTPHRDLNRRQWDDYGWIAAPAAGDAVALVTTAPCARPEEHGFQPSPPGKAVRCDTAAHHAAEDAQETGAAR